MSISGTHASALAAGPAASNAPAPAATAAAAAAAVEDRTVEFQTALLQLDLLRHRSKVPIPTARTTLEHCRGVVGGGCVNAKPPVTLPAQTESVSRKAPAGLCRLDNSRWSPALQKNLEARRDFLSLFPTPLHLCARFIVYDSDTLLACAIVALVLRTGGATTWNQPNSHGVTALRNALPPLSPVCIAILQHAAAFRALEHMPQPPLSDADFDEHTRYAFIQTDPTVLSLAAVTDADCAAVPVLHFDGDVLAHALSDPEAHDNICIALARCVPDHLLNAETAEAPPPLPRTVKVGRSLRLLAALLSRMPALDFEHHSPLPSSPHPEALAYQRRPLTLTGWVRAWDCNAKRTSDISFVTDMRPLMPALLGIGRVWYAQYIARSNAVMCECLLAHGVMEEIVSLIAEHQSVCLEPFDTEFAALWGTHARPTAVGVVSDHDAALEGARREYQSKRHTAWTSFWKSRPRGTAAAPPATAMPSAHDIAYRALFQVLFKNPHSNNQTFHEFAKTIAQRHFGCVADSAKQSSEAVDALDAAQSLEVVPGELDHFLRTIHRNGGDLSALTAPEICRYFTAPVLFRWSFYYWTDNWFQSVLITPRAIHALWTRANQLANDEEVVEVTKAVIERTRLDRDVITRTRLDRTVLFPSLQTPAASSIGSAAVAIPVARPTFLYRLTLEHALPAPNLACDMVRAMTSLELHAPKPGTRPFQLVLSRLKHEPASQLDSVMETFLSRITTPDIDLDPTPIEPTLNRSVNAACARFEAYRSGVHHKVVDVLFITANDPRLRSAPDSKQAPLRHPVTYGLPEPINAVVCVTMSFLFPSYIELAGILMG